MSLNIYKPGSGIEWTNPPGTVAGASWNPIAGCFHNCVFRMPCGAVCGCYAETIANRFHSDKVYPHGFRHNYWHPERLDAPKRKKEPHGIFIGSMADIFGQWVNGFQINEVFDVCRDTPQHTYFTLTKNPQRMRDFSIPGNVWAGCSLPGGKLISELNAQKKMFGYLFTMLEVSASVRWLSLEPLWFDVADVIKTWVESGLSLPFEWVVIGAASKGTKLYQPKPEWVQGLLDLFDEHNVPVFMKHNLDWPERRMDWPEVVKDVENG